MGLDSFHILTDEQLVKMSREGSETAQEILIEKYKGLVRQISSSYFMVGADNDDVVQEGMIGLFKAITKFDKDRAASFKTFAETCINSQILTAIKGANRMKHQPLNEAISIDKELEDEASTFIDVIPDLSENEPEAQLISQEIMRNFSDEIHASLSKLELKVLTEKLQGFEYDEIAEHLGKTPKQVDNALQRIKKKILAYLEK